MLGTTVGFVWPPHIQQCPTMPNNVGICWDKCWHRLARALVLTKRQWCVVCHERFGQEAVRDLLSVLKYLSICKVHIC